MEREQIKQKKGFPFAMPALLLTFLSCGLKQRVITNFFSLKVKENKQNTDDDLRKLRTSVYE